MIRWSVLLALTVFLLLPACSSDKENPFDPGHTNFQVPGEITLSDALNASVAGDKIILTGTGPESDDFILKPGVSIQRHTESQNDLFVILGSLSCSNSEDALIEGLKISNDDGSGLILTNCDLEVNNCWIVNCAGPGLELIGRSVVYAHNSDFEGCTPGVLIHDVNSSGHYKDDEHPVGSAPIIASNNFIANISLFEDVDNDDIDEELGPNLVFKNIAAGDTVNVALNWWGALPGIVEPDLTIWDHKDQFANQGLADTMDQYYPLAEIYPRDWRD